MYKTPYIKIEQNEEFFFLTKMNISFLIDSVNFHFRNPYSEDSKDFLDAEQYINKLESKLNVNFKDEQKGIQRRTDMKRINEISKYVSNSTGIIFPTPIVLAFNVFDNLESDSYYEFDDNEIIFHEDIEFTIIDGQHRLAGSANAYKETKNDIELPITLIPNASLSKATQMFIDINGNQRKVNKSMIYDLYENIDEKQIESIKKYINVVKILNERETSPLYNKIKRLGTGTGVISQAFLVDYIQYSYEIINKEKSTQEIYSEMFMYFKIISENYDQYWYNGSPLLKTNGIGALLLIYPVIYKDYITQDLDFKEYFSNFFKLRNQFQWDHENYSQGTGKKIQKNIADDLYNLSI